MKRQETKVYWSTINLPIFKTAILVIVSKNVKEILESIPKIYKELGIDKLHLEEDLPLFKEDLEEYGKEPYDHTVKLDNRTQDVVMVFDNSCIADVSEETIVHETHHASHMICTSRGIDDEETETYTQEYLFNQMICKIDEWNKNHKRRKQK
jgi:hypothetical protein